MRNAYWFPVGRHGLRPRDDKVGGKLIPASGDLKKLYLKDIFPTSQSK